MAQAYHIALSPDEPGEYVLLPGDPGRCEKIAAYLDHAEFVRSNREYTTYTGTLDGVRVSVTSTGIGGPSASIALEELVQCGAKTFIRVGTCGGIDLAVEGGDLIIPTGAVRQDGTGREYLPIEFPAVPSFDIVRALADEAASCGRRSRLGVVQCKDSFYGQHNPGRMPVSYELQNKWEAWKRAGVLASEMESSALYICAQTLGVRIGTVLLALWNQERKAAGLPDRECHDTDAAIATAVGAMRRLIAADRITGSASGSVKER